MPTRKRNHAYGKFNFLVDLGTGDTEGPQAAFQECNISIEVTVPEFHSRNKKENSVRKITGLNKSTDVTFKRGVIGSMNLFNWLNDIRNGTKRPLATSRSSFRVKIIAWWYRPGS